MSTGQRKQGEEKVWASLLSVYLQVAVVFGKSSRQDVSAVNIGKGLTLEWSGKAGSSLKFN